MRAHHNHNATKQVIATGMLALLLAVASTSGLARGLRGGGQAGALGDFDLFLQTDTTNGLPVNLVNGLEHANNTAGDATVGVGGTFNFDPNQQTINSRDGSAITLLPSIVVWTSRAGLLYSCCEAWATLASQPASFARTRRLPTPLRDVT